VTDRSGGFDLVLLGATGYVGRLTAQQLAEHAPAGLRVALAARSAERLDQLGRELGPVAQEWPRLTVDATDAASVGRLARSARVVASTVGPYLRYGLPLVQACAEAGTDYLDLTGETLFVRRSIDTCHVIAVASGARIVHSCGFDSVPSDLGVGLCAEQAAAEGRGRLTEATLHVRSMRGGVSGGTVDSFRQQVIETSADRGLRALARDPRTLTGETPAPADGQRAAPAGPAAGSTRRGAGRSMRPPVARDPWTGRWQVPFVMGGFNRQIVLRSNALSGYAYGPDFSYREVLDTGTGPLGLAAAAALAAGSTALLGGMWFAPTRRLLDRVLPDPGQGPSERTRREGRFLVEVVADTTDGSRYRTRVGADLDFGYAGTAVMFSQAALCLTLDRDLPTAGGVLTPMLAMGRGLAERLRSRGFTVETERLAPGPARG
jgi:short subunit dehydrogenase-like uncharacterized protein